MSHKKHRLTRRRQLRLGSGLEQIEPRLLLAAAVEPVVQMGPAAPGKGGFLNLAPAYPDFDTAQVFSAGNLNAREPVSGVATTGSTVVYTVGNVIVQDMMDSLAPLKGTIILRYNVDRGPGVVPTPTPSPSKLPDDGGFLPLPRIPPGGLTDHGQERVTMMEEPARSVGASSPPPINLGAALQLQPARGQANAFQLASSAAPEIPSTIQRIAPPLPGTALSSSPIAKTETLQPSLKGPWSPDVAIASQDEVQSNALTIRLAGAVHMQVQSDLEPSDSVEAGHELANDSREAAMDLLAAITSNDETPASTAHNERHVEAPGTSLMMASATMPGAAPSSQTAMVVTLAILVWQAGTAYFLPADTGASRLLQAR